MYWSGFERLDHPVRKRNQAPGGMRRCCDSHCFTRSTVRRKSGLLATSAVTSITQAGASKFLGLVFLALFFGRALPPTPLMGGAKFVAVVSPVSNPVS